MSEAVDTRTDPKPDQTPDPTPAPSKAGALYELTKPGIAGYVMMTAGVSYYVASGGTAEILPITHTLVGVALGTAGALALNQYVERDLDAVMIRTQTRPLPSGRLRPGEALLFGWALLVAGLARQSQPLLLGSKTGCNGVGPKLRLRRSKLNSRPPPFISSRSLLAWRFHV